jgi:hypothetical protein
VGTCNGHRKEHLEKTREDKVHPLPPTKDPEESKLVVEDLTEEEEVVKPWWLKGVIKPQWVDTDESWLPPSEDAPMRTTWVAPPPWALQGMNRL